MNFQDFIFSEMEAVEPRSPKKAPRYSVGPDQMVGITYAHEAWGFSQEMLISLAESDRELCSRLHYSEPWLRDEILFAIAARRVRRSRDRVMEVIRVFGNKLSVLERCQLREELPETMPHAGVWDVWTLRTVAELVRKFGKFSAAVAALINKLADAGRFNLRAYSYSQGVHLNEAVQGLIGVLTPTLVHHGVHAPVAYLWLKSHGKMAVPLSGQLSYGRVWRHVLRVAREQGDYQALALLSQYDPSGKRWDRDAKPEGPLACLEARDQEWLRVFGRYPKNGWVRSLPVEWIAPLRGCWKYFQRLLPEGAAADQHTVLATAKLALIFGARAQNVVAANGGSVHDAGVNLPDPMKIEKEEAEFLFRHRTQINDAARIIGNWSYVSDQGGNLHMPLKELAAIASSMLYKNVRHSALAVECTKHGLDQNQFESVQGRWQLKGWETIPAVSVEVDGYRMYRLDFDDPRGIFLGVYTDCCQYPGGAGEACAWHGQSSPEGAFFAVEKHGKIVAQSWVWRVGATVCFDNVEAKSGLHGQAVLVALYSAAAEKLCGKLGITTVTAGLGFDDAQLTGQFPEVAAVDRKLPGYYGYTDARSQVLLHGTAAVLPAGELNDYMIVPQLVGWPGDEA
jgi:hypothetical protein